jgi:hypothetical protein
MEREFQGGGQSLRARMMPRNPNVPTRALVDTKGLRAWDATPAYHGTLAIDPSTGAIVRLTLDAELDPANTISRASTIVEYGRVVIGDQAFICPVRSLAISSQQGPPPTEEDPQRRPIIAINETTFTQYHRLGSSARMIADGAPSEGVPLPRSGELPPPSPGNTGTSSDTEVSSFAAQGSTQALADAVNRDGEMSDIAVSAAMAPAETGLTVKVSIAAANVGMHQEDGRWMGKLEIALIQRGGTRDRVDNLTLNLRLKPETRQRMLTEGIPFQYTLDMQSGMTSMRILVLDEITGRLGSVTIPSSALQTGKQSAVGAPQAEKP